jgi:NADPH:quinone reductase-like Zn-dependent oxidoreductase
MPMNAVQVHVRKDGLTDAVLADVPLPELADGAVRLAVESFSVTANNVTYAVAGDSFKYWDFFPAPEGSGIVPMWGHARVIASHHPEIAVGERVYGYLPMASHLDVIPGRVSAGGFSDMADHRQPMSPVYNSYTRLAADPEHDPAREAERMIFGPLFRTGFLIEYFLRGADWFGAEQLVVTSASSKTALGLASVARQSSPEVRRIGLTSQGNVAFVEATGLYDQVVAYDDLERVPVLRSISVDFAGNAELLGRIHRHFEDALAHSALVGMTHIEARSTFGGGEALPGPKPALFFAPDHAVAFFKAHGPEEGGKLVAAAWHEFLKAADGAVAIERLPGLAAARDTFTAMVAGQIDPAKGIVIEP